MAVYNVDENLTHVLFSGKHTCFLSHLLVLVLVLVLVLLQLVLTTALYIVIIYNNSRSVTHMTKPKLLH